MGKTETDQAVERFFANPTGTIVDPATGRRLPLYSANGGFIDTREGVELANMYGPRSEEYQTAKAAWEQGKPIEGQRISKELAVYENTEFGQLRVIMEYGEPWFVAADVCRVLEIDNSRQALTRLDEDEKKNTVISNDGNRGNPNMTIVNEPGLYTLVLGSRKPEAKAFKRWLTHEVIPAIRKTGRYERPSTLPAVIERPTVDAKAIRAQAMLLNAQTRHIKMLTQVVPKDQLIVIAAQTLGFEMAQEQEEISMAT